MNFFIEMGSLGQDQVFDANSFMVVESNQTDVPISLLIYGQNEANKEFQQICRWV